MHLSFNYKDKIFWITNFLPSPTYKKFHDEAFWGYGKQLKFEDTKKQWQKNLFENLNNTLKYTVNNDYFKILDTMYKHNHIFTINKKSKNTYVIHSMCRGAGINWHEDDHVEYAVTYYLNHRWHPNWGGEFMFRDDTTGLKGYIPPTGNSIVIVKGGTLHKVNPVLYKRVPRITVQLFVKKENEKI